MFRAKEALENLLSGSVTKFSNDVDEILMSKVGDAIDQKRVEMGEEDIQELSKETLRDYIHASAYNISDRSREAERLRHKMDGIPTGLIRFKGDDRRKASDAADDLRKAYSREIDSHEKKISNRKRGIRKALSRITR